MQGQHWSKYIKSTFLFNVEDCRANIGASTLKGHFYLMLNIAGPTLEQVH